MRLIMDEIADEYEDVRRRNVRKRWSTWLREFHTQLAERLHNGEDVLDLIPE